MKVPTAKASGKPIQSPLDPKDLIEQITVFASDGSEADWEQLIVRLRELSESKIRKLNCKKVPGVYGGRLKVIEYLCVVKPSSKELFCEVLKILLGNAVVDTEMEKDDVDSSGFPPLLHLAAYCGNYEAVKVLCSTKGTNFFAKDRKNGFNVLHVAVISGDTRIAREIMDKACRESIGNFADLLLNGWDNRRLTPLHYAAWEGNKDMTEILLNWKRMDEVAGTSHSEVEVNDKRLTNEGFTAVHLAAMNHDKALLQLLLDYRSATGPVTTDSFLRNNPGESVSMRERMLKEFDEAESHILELSSARESVLRRRKLDSPSMKAAVPLWNELMKGVKADGKAEDEERKQTGVEADTELEANEELEGFKDSTLMFFVKAIRMLESSVCGEIFQEVLCGLLLSLTWSDMRDLSRLKVPGANEGKLTICAHLCVTKPCLKDVLKILIRASTAPNVEKFEGYTIPLLHLSAYCSNYAAVKVMCHVWNVDLTKSSTGLTALHMAVKGGDKETIEWLINYVQQKSKVFKELVNCKDGLGMTPLHYAVWEGNQNMLEVLVSKMKDVIDMDVSDRNGLTVLHLAALNNDHGILGKLLNDTRVNVNASDKHGVTSLHVASWKNHFGVFSKLLGHEKINVNFAAENGHTALHMAAWKGHNEILRKLLDHPQINVNASDNTGLTAFLLPQGDSQDEMSKGFTLLGESIRESLQTEFDKLESHLWQFAMDRRSTLEKLKAESRQMTTIAPVSTAPQETRQLLRGDEIRRRAARLLFNDTELGENKKSTALHRAVWEGKSAMVTSLLDMISKAARARAAINALDEYGMTALHWAVMRGDADMVEDLLSKKKIVRGNIQEERFHRTPLNMAYRLGKRDNLKGFTEDERREILREYKVIIGFLLEHPDVKAYIEGLYRDRQLFVDAANAILVGAALIASITFAGWLQPPLGYQPIYDSKYLLTGEAPPDTYATYAAVTQHVSVKLFWIFNSLSFFFAIATVLLGACVVLPMLGKDELEADVTRMRNLHVWTTLSLSSSVLFVLGAFISAGFASLPPELEYQWGMITSTLVGGSLSIIALCYYLYRVITLMNKIRRTRNGAF